MQLVIITPQSSQPGEHHLITSMMEEGLQTVHVRKPKFSTNQLRHYIEGFDQKYHDRLVIHSHHELAATYKLKGIHLTKGHRTENYFSTWLKLKYIQLRRSKITVSTSFHSISSLETYNPIYDYVFISPIFESISKLGYKNNFNAPQLETLMQQTHYKVYGLGGVKEDNVELARDMGFHGVVLYGSLWENNDTPVETFVKIRDVCNKLKERV